MKYKWNLKGRIATKDFCWNEDTIDHFKLISNYTSKSEIRKQIANFVEIDCTLENGETEEELIIDLISKIY